MSVSAWPIIHSAYLARVIATFSLRHSDKKPMPLGPTLDCAPPLASGARTHVKIMMSISRPWKPSTVLISTRFAALELCKTPGNLDLNWSRIALICWL
jgi:hypothetical protein